MSETCTTCGLPKKPIGRDAPLAMANGLCDYECPGYLYDPQPGTLWPSERLPAPVSPPPTGPEPWEAEVERIALAALLFRYEALDDTQIIARMVERERILRAEQGNTK